MEENKTFDFNGMQISGQFGSEQRAININGDELYIGNFEDHAFDYNTNNNTDSSGNPLVDIRDRLHCSKPSDTHSNYFKNDLRDLLLGKDILPTRHTLEGAIFLPEVP